MPARMKGYMVWQSNVAICAFKGWDLGGLDLAGELKVSGKSELEVEACRRDGVGGWGGGKLRPPVGLWQPKPFGVHSPHSAPPGLSSILHWGSPEHFLLLQLPLNPSSGSHS